MVESKDKGFGLMTPTEFDEKDPNNPKYSDKEKYIKEKIKQANNNLQEQLIKQKFKFVAYVTGIIFISVGSVIGIKLINPSIESFEAVIYGIGFGCGVSLLTSDSILNDKKSKRIRQEIEGYETDLKDIAEERKKEKELELSKRLENFNFEKKYEELTKDKYLEGMKRYLIDLQNLAETNPELAKKVVNKSIDKQRTYEMAENDYIKSFDVSNHFEPVVLTELVQKAVKNSANVTDESDVPNIPSAYVDDNGDLQHTDQSKKLVKKPKTNK